MAIAKNLLLLQKIAIAFCLSKNNQRVSRSEALQDGARQLNQQRQLIATIMRHFKQANPNS